MINEGDKLQSKLPIGKKRTDDGEGCSEMGVEYKYM